MLQPGVIEKVPDLLEGRERELRRGQAAKLVLIGGQLIDVGRAEALVDAQCGRQCGTVPDEIVTFVPALGQGGGPTFRI